MSLNEKAYSESRIDVRTLLVRKLLLIELLHVFVSINQ